MREILSSAISEVAKSESKNNTFNPDKRLDVSNNEVRSSHKSAEFNPDKRVDINSSAKDSKGLVVLRNVK